MWVSAIGWRPDDLDAFDAAIAGRLRAAKQNRQQQTPRQDTRFSANRGNC